jgi:hypothetical protein
MDCDSLAVLVSKCPNLTFLDASNNHLLDDAFLAVLANSCPKLVKLYLVSLLVITDLGIESLTSKCRNLEVLHIPSAGKISDASLRSLTNCPNLRVLELRSMPKVTNQGYVFSPIMQRNWNILSEGNSDYSLVIQGSPAFFSLFLYLA